MVMQNGGTDSVGFGGGEVAHQGVDLAGRNGHGKALDGADFLFADALFPGHAKVVRNSWSTLPGNGRRQADDGLGAPVQAGLVAHGVVEVAVGFVLCGRQHDRKWAPCVDMV